MTPETYNMTEEEYDKYIEDCIKSEIETFHPEEFERTYGEKSRYYTYTSNTKVYTYYDNIEFHQQEELLNLWKKSWEKRGFQAKVLSEDDAKKSPYYQEFINELESIHKFITGNSLGKYGATCYKRWLAYSVQDETDAFLVCDYDVINKNFTLEDLKEPTGKITFLDGVCPCFVLGTKDQFLNFCKDTVNLTKNSLEKTKEAYQKASFRHFHDQEFVVLNKLILNHYNICPPKKYVDLYEHGNPKMEESKVLHFAHRSLGEAKINFPGLQNIDSDELRIKFVKDTLGFEF